MAREVGTRRVGASTDVVGAVATAEATLVLMVGKEGRRRTGRADWVVAGPEEWGSAVAGLEGRLGSGTALLPVGGLAEMEAAAEAAGAAAAWVEAGSAAEGQAELVETARTEAMEVAGAAAEGSVGGAGTQVLPEAKGSLQTAAGSVEEATGAEP